MSIFEDIGELPANEAAYVTYFVPERNSKRLKIFWVDVKEDKDSGKRYRLVGPKFHSVKEVFQFYEENSLAWPTVKCKISFNFIHFSGLGKMKISYHFSCG